jgi:hypothetical protein
VQLGGGIGYCISAETAGIRCTTHGPLKLLVLMFKYCTSLVTHCHCSVSHELGEINTEPLTVPVECISLSFLEVQNSSYVCRTASVFTVFQNFLESDTQI